MIAALARTRRALVPALALALAPALAGCESTQDKSARLAKQGAKLVSNQKGLQIAAANPDVKIVSSAVLHDANGAAAVVTLRNLSTHALTNVPIAIDVLDARGASLFKNNAPGLEASLTSAPLLLPRQDFTWVNDQVQASTGTPARVTVEVGRAPTAPAAPAALTLGGVHLSNDPTSGVTADGSVLNHGSVEQQRLVIYAVARRAGQIVAAGRAIVPKAAPAKPTPFHVYFIGPPQGAQLELAAPPTTLR